MRCANCGTSNPGGAKFCLECGRALTTAESAASRLATPAPDAAERRQLTCLFCDLENSVQLSESIDPEELRNILAAYQQVCATVIRRFEGYVARYFGDGILVYFGFPHAHDDEPQRAVRTALGILGGLKQLSSRLERERGIRLRVRVGIHTGLVVAGDIAPGSGLETMAAIGVTPNIAARLQSFAEPDSIVISATTFGLVVGYFDCHELGFHTIRGISEPMAIYQVLHESGARTRLDVAALRGLGRMEGRGVEIAFLTDRWQQACSGHGKAVLVRGEPGIGKSRLLWAMEEHVAQSPEASLVKLSCSPYFQNTAFYPVIEFLERLVLQFNPDDSVSQRLDKIDGYLAQMGLVLEEAVPLLADLLGVAYNERYSTPEVPAGRRRQMTMDLLVRLVLMRAEQQPLLIVVEDLQWADPSSLDVLKRIVDESPTNRLLTLMSQRAEFASPWPSRAELEELLVGRLDRSASVAIVTAVAGQPLPDELLELVLNEAEGVPLYLEELTKLVLQMEVLHQSDGHFELAGPLPRVAIPATLADSLMARLDRLTTAKPIAQLGATIGRSFSRELLTAVLRAGGPVHEDALDEQLRRLVESGLVFTEGSNAGARFTFKHAMVQDAAYESLLRTTRQDYHRRIAQTLVSNFQSTVESAPELVAHHYAGAGEPAESVPYWLRAGKRALRASAYSEAIAQIRSGLDELNELPASPERASQELQLRLTLGPAFMATRGYAAPEVEECYDSARQLCRELGDAPPLAPVLHGLWTYRIVRAQHRAALELAQQVLELGNSTGDDGLILQGNMDCGWSLFFQGRLAPARVHLERVLALYDAERHSGHLFTFGDNPATSAGGCLAQVLWLLGYPQAALERSEQTVRMLRTLNHPYSLVFGLDLAGFVRQYRGDPAATRILVDEAIAESSKHGLAFIEAMGSILRGWVRTQAQDLQDGLQEMRDGLVAQLGTGAELVRPFWFYLQAEALGRTGQVAEGLALLDQAEQVVQATDERYWEAEVHRMRGHLMASGSAGFSATAALDCYLRALDIARGQGARSLELRAAISLALLLRGEGKLVEARNLLLPLYESFTEGFDTPDLREAAVLLGDLGVPTEHMPIATRRG